MLAHFLLIEGPEKRQIRLSPASLCSILSVENRAGVHRAIVRRDCFGVCASRNAPSRFLIALLSASPPQTWARKTRLLPPITVRPFVPADLSRRRGLVTSRPASAR